MKLLISKRQIWKFKKFEQEVQIKKITSKISITEFPRLLKNQSSPNQKRGAFQKDFIKI